VRRALLAAVSLGALQLLAAAEGAADGPAERYRYEATPEGRHGSEARERIEIECTRSGTGVRYASKVESSGGTEVTTLSLDGEGRFVSGERTTLAPSGSKPTTDRIWRRGDVAYAEIGSDEATPYRLPPDHSLAVDGSLLLLLRSFPFGEGQEWKVFMLDFSGASITVSLRQAGTETVTVPAGTFECYRMEVEVPIPLLRPKITYWISKQEPHYLVRQQGKRGPFTRSYVTVLTAVE
jgi:hypothetical protein